MLEPKEVNLSPMPKTWILDWTAQSLSMTGPYILGHDKFLPGAKEFLDGISEYDMIIFLTARGEWEKEHTLRFLKENHVRYDHIIFGAGQGERVLINDNKPDGLVTAVAVNTTINSARPNFRRIIIWERGMIDFFSFRNSGKNFVSRGRLSP